MSPNSRNSRGTSVALTLRRRIGEALLVGADIAGVVLAGSGAAVVAFLGKLMFAVVLGAISLGFFLRLVGRRQVPAVAPQPTPAWARAASAALAAVEVAVLVESVNFPVRFNQPGFAPWHWALVVLALLVADALNQRFLRSVTRSPVREVRAK